MRPMSIRRGMIEHSHNIGEVRGKLFAEFAEDHFMTF
jgi:hypothetical protein